MGTQILQPVSAIVLAAGYSRRMGNFKPLLPLGNGTVLSTVVDQLRAAGVDDVCVVTGHHAETLHSEIARLGARSAYNPDFDRGMYSSIVRGISALPDSAEACLLLPVDIPLVRAASVRQLLRHPFDARTQVLYPTFRGQRGHPPMIRRSLFVPICAHQDPAGGLKALLQQHQDAATELALCDQGILYDMDTPEDYCRLSALAARRLIPSAEECEALLARFQPDDRLERHLRRVAQVARCIAEALIHNGVALDLEKIWAGALLHDIAKDGPNHAFAGAVIMHDFGFTDIATIIAQHMDLEFSGDVPDDAAIVYLADKMVWQDQIVGLEARFQPAFERFSDNPEALRGARRRYASARVVADAIERLTGCPLSQLLAATRPGACRAPKPDRL